MSSQKFTGKSRRASILVLVAALVWGNTANADLAPGQSRLAGTRSIQEGARLANRGKRSECSIGSRSQSPLSNFALKPGSEFVFAGFLATFDGMKPWSIKVRNARELAFEVRPGDRLFNPRTGYSDPRTSERAEIGISSVRWGNGTAVTVQYEFLVPAGFDFKSPWTVTAQMHAGLPVPPPLEIGFRRDQGLNRLLLTLRGGNSKKFARNWRTSERKYQISGGPITRNSWHHIRIETKMGADGYVRAWFNRSPVVDIRGKIGYSDQTSWYWRMGLYRRATQDTYRICFRNLEIKQANS